MKKSFGPLETQVFAYAQLRQPRTIRRGELAQALRLTQCQEAEVLSQLAQGGLIARERRGLYLVPLTDLVVRHGEDVYIIDAKNKGYFKELDNQRWAELAEELRSEHRHDLHQVLAYASLFDAHRVTAVLAYPMFTSTRLRLSSSGHATISANPTHGGRELQLVLIGLPLQVPEACTTEDLAVKFDYLRQSSTSFTGSTK